MESISRQKCLEFIENPKKNPITNRKIQERKQTYEKLLRSCHKDIKAPSMGPMIHWKQESNILKQYEHLLTFVKYIYAHIRKWEAAQFTGPYSKMLLEEYRDILTIAKDQFKSQNYKIHNLSVALLDKIRHLHATKMVLNDLPKQKVVSKLKVKPSRLYVREQVAKIYILYKTFASIERPTRKQIEYMKDKKKYLDYIIHKKIFRREDIYGKWFPSEQNFAK